MPRLGGLLVGPLLMLALLDVSGALTVAAGWTDIRFSLAAAPAPPQGFTPTATERPENHPESGFQVHSSSTEADLGHPRRHRERVPMLVVVVQRGTRVLAARQQSPHPGNWSGRSPDSLTAYAPLRL